MIEITRVEPKKIQRKLLTEEQKNDICENNPACSRCPLFTTIAEQRFCWKEITQIERKIKTFWNEEVEVDL